MLDTRFDANAAHPEQIRCLLGFRHQAFLNPSAGLPQLSFAFITLVIAWINHVQHFGPTAGLESFGQIVTIAGALFNTAETLPLVLILFSVRGKRTSLETHTLNAITTLSENLREMRTEWWNPLYLLWLGLWNVVKLIGSVMRTACRWVWAKIQRDGANGEGV